VPSETDTIADPLHSERTLDGQPAGRRPCLVVLAGTEAGRVIPLNAGTHVIGRTDEAHIVIPHNSVSRSHVEIVVRPSGKVFARDLGSTNGTRVNGTPVGPAPQPLEHDDRIRLSKRVMLKFTLQDALEAGLHRDLYTSAVQDGLTGAYNKRYLLDRLEEEFSYAARGSKPLSVLIFDLDHFKRVNDTFGHAAGDLVLVETARIVATHLRSEDIFARYGGEEFVVLMRDTTLQVAAEVGERLRELIASEPVDFQGTEIRVTVSVGVTAMPPVQVGSAMDLFVRADRLLYQAKETGRDKVCVEVPN
jgi:two-component system cell cycle response regulator